MTGFEPATSRFTVWCSNQLNYIRHTRVVPIVLVKKGAEIIERISWKAKRNFEREISPPYS